VRLHQPGLLPSEPRRGPLETSTRRHRGAGARACGYITCAQHQVLGFFFGAAVLQPGWVTTQTPRTSLTLAVVLPVSRKKQVRDVTSCCCVVGSPALAALYIVLSAPLKSPPLFPRPLPSPLSRRLPPSMTAAFRGAQLLRVLGLAAVLVVAAAVADVSPHVLRAAMSGAESAAAGAAAAAGDVELTMDCSSKNAKQLFSVRAVKAATVWDGSERKVVGILCTVTSWLPLSVGTNDVDFARAKPMVLLISTFSSMEKFLGVPVEPMFFGTALVLASGAHTQAADGATYRLTLDVVKATNKKANPAGNPAYKITIPHAVVAAFGQTQKAKTRGDSSAALRTAKKTFLVLKRVSAEHANKIMDAVSPLSSKRALKDAKKCKVFLPEFNMNNKQAIRRGRGLARAFRGSRAHVDSRRAPARRAPARRAPTCPARPPRPAPPRFIPSPLQAWPSPAPKEMPASTRPRQNFAWCSFIRTWRAPIAPSLTAPAMPRSPWPSSATASPSPWPRLPWRLRRRSQPAARLTHTITRLAFSTRRRRKAVNMKHKAVSLTLCS
jgi:hypothetical protein